MLHSQPQTWPDKSIRQGRCVPKQRRGKGARPMCSTRSWVAPKRCERVWHTSPRNENAC
nr:MAG TPA: hypothetical protein [Caudoviricetes sp.]